MDYIRAYSYNILSPDNYREKKQVCDRLEDEVFKDVKKLILRTDDSHYTFTDKDIELVRESYNYIAVKDKNQKMFIIKESEIRQIEFYI
jgi:hypothetical protein